MHFVRQIINVVILCDSSCLLFLHCVSQEFLMWLVGNTPNQTEIMSYECTLQSIIATNFCYSPMLRGYVCNHLSTFPPHCFMAIDFVSSSMMGHVNSDEKAHIIGRCLGYNKLLFSVLHVSKVYSGPKFVRERVVQ